MRLHNLLRSMVARSCVVLVRGQRNLTNTASLSSSSARHDHSEVQHFYSQYVQAFVTGDMKSVSTVFYRAPVTVSMNRIQADGDIQSVRLTVDTSTEIEQLMNDQLKQLIDRGYAGRSDMQPITLTSMSENSALIQTSGIRYHSCGAVLEYIRASYIVERSGGGVHGEDKSASKKWYIRAVYGDASLKPM